MKNELHKCFFYLFKLHFFYLMLLSMSFTNCIIEIPLKKVKVEGIPKHRHIKIKKLEDDFEEKKRIMLIDEGSVILNTNSLFLGTVTIGSNNQKFNLVLDTGSSIAWVAKIGSKDKYKINRHFNPSSSTSSVNTKIDFTLQYGTGYCKGYYYRDYFNFVGDKKFNIKFGVADETELGVENGDGIIGLAHYYKQEDESFIHMLKKAEITDSMAFSFKFNEDNENDQYGKMYIGKHDDFSNNNTVTCPLLTYKGEANLFWGCEISGFGLRNSNYDFTFSKSYINIIFDTGTNVILLPMDFYRDIQNSLSKLGCTSVIKDSHCILVCYPSYEVPKLTLKINGNTFIIPSSQAFYRSSSYYISNFQFVDSNIYIIGSPFFLTFHTLFDKENEQLHFFPLKTEYLEIGFNYVTIIVIVAISIILVIIFGCIIYRFVKWKKARDLENNFPSSDYNYV